MGAVDSAWGFTVTWNGSKVRIIPMILQQFVLNSIKHLAQVKERRKSGSGEPGQIAITYTRGDIMYTVRLGIIATPT